MLRGMIKKVKTSGNLFAPSIRMVICIPSGSTNVEIRAVRDSAEHAGGREVYMIYEPMAAALGAGLDVEAPEGNMVIDIGGGTTEIACISLGGIVCSESINVAGDVFTNDIQSTCASSTTSVSANARPRRSSVRSVRRSPSWTKSPRITW